MKNFKYRKNRFIIVILSFMLHPGMWLFAQQEISLKECHRMALEHNHKIRQARKKAEASTSMRKAAFTRFLPEFSAEGTYFRLNKKLNLTLPEQYLPVTDAQGNPVLMTGPDGNLMVKNYAWLPEQDLEFGEKNIYAAGLTMNQTIYAGGKVREMHRIAGSRERIAGMQAELKESEVLYETAKKYWKVVSVKEKVILARAYRKQVDSLINDLENLRQEGIITANEILKAKVRRNEVRLKLTKAENGLKLAQMALNQMSGMPLDTSWQLKDSLGEVNAGIDVADFRYKALNKRPEVKMLQQRVSISESGVELSKSRFMPDVALSANYYFLNPNPFNNFKNQFGHDWMVGVVCQVPLFHWGDRLHTLNAAKLEKEIAHLKLEETKEKIQLQVQQQIFKLQEAYKEVELTQTSLKQAKENLEITKNNLNEGLAKTTDVLEAQAMWQKAKASEIQAKTDLQLAWLALQKAIGELDL
ncbi:MAG: TolC family protein [Bacteroidales bacterium]|nr:TolC family protein [Bacteroidales bacterium]